MKVGIIGTGGRSVSYIKALKALSEDFELCSMRFRTQEKADLFKKEYDIPATTSMDEFKSSKPDFVVDVVGYYDVGKAAADLLRDDIPVLAETPPAATVQELCDLWNLSAAKKSKILVAENYFEEPPYAAMIEAVKRGYLGDAQTVTVANTHEYHAFSVMRIILDEMNSPLTMIGKKMDLELTLTNDHAGNSIRDGSIEIAERYHVILNFANGKTGFYDFAISQYWSDIRSYYIMVQGSRGEIKDKDIWFLDSNQIPRQSCFHSNLTGDGGLVSISIRDDVVYENKLLSKGIGDNIGVCSMLLNMKNYLETGFAPYPFADGLQDAYLTKLLHECGSRPFELIQSEKMPWQK
ncbi:MAG: Gfo/Idh/MocA family oxidoreductase [Clostridiales bacterium]|jgi:predicted dehydrogenase|nr:Gfo/Idh/MocA family oxidoreductase [Clostridiales bacterium]